MSKEKFEYMIDSMELLSKYEGASEIYYRLLYKFIEKLPRRIARKVTPILRDVKNEYLKEINKEILNSKIEHEFDERIKELKND